MALKSKWLRTFIAIAFLGCGSLGCELDECTDDPATEENECADIFAPVSETGAGEEAGDTDVPECAQDGYCDFACVDEEGAPQDADCNPNVPGLASEGQVSQDCDCDYWGFVCETAEPCSIEPCDCDPDCNHPDGSMGPCAAGDAYCDSNCPVDVDPDCLGRERSQGNGQYCEDGEPGGSGEGTGGE